MTITCDYYGSLTDCYQFCEHYSECELCLPFDNDIDNQLREIRAEISFKRWKLANKVLTKDEVKEIKKWIRSLKRQEFMRLFHLKKLRDKELKLLDVSNAKNDEVMEVG